MFSSLRSRLWLSYVLVISMVLLVVGTGLSVTIARSPLIYRQSILRLRLVEETLVSKARISGGVSREQIIAFLQREASNRQLRFLLVNHNGTLLFDTGVANKLARILLPNPITATNKDTLSMLTLRDTSRAPWLFISHEMDDQTFLLIGTSRPNIQLLSVLRDDVIAPIIRVGLIAFVLTFLISLAMARWITLPLQRLSRGAHELASGKFPILILEGPKEVQDLANSFNIMTKKVQTSQQSQREFIANVSHELKTPLTSIQGFAQAILEGAVETPSALRQSANVIFEEAERMSRLVMDLLSLARLEDGTVEIHLVSVNLELLLRSIVEKFAFQAQKYNMVIDYQQISLPQVHGDGDRLAQVFTNIIDNALKYSPVGGRIEISAKQVGSLVEARIKDRGLGIRAEDQKRIFERFFQVDKSRKGGSVRGVGLGLAIARQIMLAQKGDLLVESTPGLGSEFIVRIPVAGSSSAAIKIGNV